MQPKKICENSPTDFFYTQLPEDEKLQLFQTHQILDSEAILRPLSSEFNSNVFILDETACERIQTLFSAFISVNGRKQEFSMEDVDSGKAAKGQKKELSPEVSISIEEISMSAENYIQTTLGKRSKLLLKGGGILYVIHSMLPKIFETWCTSLAGKHELLTPSFQTFLKLFPNDFDWELGVEGEADEKVHQLLVEKVLLDPLAAKFKILKCNPFDLVLKLLNEKVHNKSKYFTSLMNKYGEISSTMPNLERLCIEAFAFATAANVSTPRSQFSLRRLKDSQSCHDCVLSSKTSILPTFRESLAIDLRPLLNKKIASDPLVLQSMMGNSIEKVLQALSNYNLLITTFDPDKAADVTDFARTVSHFTSGGRCYQNGWIKKSVQALIEGCKDQGLSLSELLGKQLVGRIINHHKNEPAILVALTFNASALLSWIDSQNEAEIQKLWQFVFSYIDKIENKSNVFLKAPIIEMIQIAMRDPNFKFKDLYYIYIQLGSQIEQHCKIKPASYSTQTEGHLFTQWQIIFEQSKSTKMSEAICALKPPVCALFFPYKISDSLKYIETLTEIPSPLPTFFHNIASNHALCFEFGHSRLSKSFQDPRREFKISLNRGLNLLQRKQESFWLLGFLTILPLMALKQDSRVLKKVLGHFIGMLKSHWASDALKHGCIALFCRTLKESNLAIPFKVFEALKNKRNRKKLSTYIELTIALVKTGEKAFLEYAYEQLELIDVSQFDYPTLKNLYGELLNQSIEMNVNASLEANDGDRPEIATDARVQWLDQFLGKIIRHFVFLPAAKLEWLIACYQKLPVLFLEQQRRVEGKLFEGILLTLEQMKIIDQPVDISIWKLLFNSQNRISSPFKAMRLIKALTRLSLWNLTQTEQISLIVQIDKDKKLDLSFYFQVPEQSDEAPAENSFDQEIAKLNKLPSHSDEIDKLIYLMSEWIEKKKDFEKLNALLSRVKDQIFKNLSLDQKVELCRLLTRFQSKFLKNQPDVLYSCINSFLSLPSLNAPTEFFLKSQLIELVYNLLKHPSKRNVFADEAYRKFLAEIRLLPQQERIFLRDDSETFLHELQARKMDQEIFDFFELAGYPFTSSKLSNFCVYIEALERQKTRLIYEDKPLLIYPVSAENLEVLLLNAPSIPKSTDDHLPSILTEIYQFLASSHQKSNSMVEAYEWFRKEIRIQRKIRSQKNKEEFYLRAYRFIHELIQSKYYLEAYQATLQLDFLPVHKVHWLKMGLSFLLQKQTLYSTLLFEKKIPMNGLLNETKETYSEEWQQLFNLLISNSFEVAKGESDTGKKLLASMHAIIYDIFKNSKISSKETWKLYFHVLTLNGPLEIVEKVFEEFFCSENLPLTESERQECGSWFIERFNKEGSAFLLTNDKCWPSTEEDYSGNSLRTLLKGALKAKKRHQLNPNIVNRQFDKIQKITEKHYVKLDKKYHESFFNDVTFCNEPFYYVAKLFSSSTSERLLTKGAQAIVLLLIDNSSDALLVRKSILLTSVYSEKMQGLREKNSIASIFAAITFSISSPYCMGTDYVKFLRLTNTLVSSCINIKEKSKNRRVGDVFFKSGTKYFEMKYKLIEKIIENPWIDNCKYSRQDKELIGSSLREIVAEGNFNTLCLVNKKRSRVKKVVDSDTTSILTKVFDDPHRWRNPSLNERLSVQATENISQMINAKNRFEILKKDNRLMHWKLMDSEFKAMKSCCCIFTGACLVPFLMITGLVLGILSSMYRSNQA